MSLSDIQLKINSRGLIESLSELKIVAEGLKNTARSLSKAFKPLFKKSNHSRFHKMRVGKKRF